MRYFSMIELPQDGSTSYGVVVPDFPGCSVAGDTFDEALANAKEAISKRLESMNAKEQAIPQPSSPEEVTKKLKKGWVCYGIDIEPHQLLTKAKRINITVPESVLHIIDQEAKKRHQSRSAFLADAALSEAKPEFKTVNERVEAPSNEHSLSAEDSLPRLKRYLSESRYRIQLEDLIDETVGQVLETMPDQDFSAGQEEPTDESSSARVRSYEEACSTLLNMATVAGSEAEQEHCVVWQRALYRLAIKSGEVSYAKSSKFGYAVCSLMKWYPTLLLYALGLGAVRNERFHFLEYIFSTPIYTPHLGNFPAVTILPLHHLLLKLKFPDEAGYSSEESLRDKLRPHTKSIITDDSLYKLLFDKLDILIALSYVYRKGDYQERFWAQVGALKRRPDNVALIFREIEESISRSEQESVFVKSHIFGETVEECSDLIRKLKGLYA